MLSRERQLRCGPDGRPIAGTALAGTARLPCGRTGGCATGSAASGGVRPLLRYLYLAWGEPFLQADHTLLDLLILDEAGKAVRPWLTTVVDDHSRAVAGTMVFLGAPSTLQTSLALRQAIWCKADPS